MKLYLAVNLPEGKRIRLRDKWTDKVDYKVAPILYPNKPTEVVDEKAERLLEQDPHLVSKKPFGQVEVEVKEEDKELDQNQGPENEIGVILRELAKKDFSTLKAAEIIEYGKKLGIEIPFNVKREMKEQMLEDKCRELAG